MIGTFADGVIIGRKANGESRLTPMIGFLPKLIAWLGYDPFPEPTTAGEEIVAMRRRRGLSRKKLARQLVIDETTLKKIEKSEMVLTERVVEVMRETLTARSDQETREAANL